MTSGRGKMFVAGDLSRPPPFRGSVAGAVVPKPSSAPAVSKPPQAHVPKPSSATDLSLLVCKPSVPKPPGGGGGGGVGGRIAACKPSAEAVPLVAESGAKRQRRYEPETADDMQYEAENADGIIDAVDSIDTAFHANVADPLAALRDTSIPVSGR